MRREDGDRRRKWTCNFGILGVYFKNVMVFLEVVVDKVEEKFIWIGLFFFQKTSFPNIILQ